MLLDLFFVEAPATQAPFYFHKRRGQPGQIMRGTSGPVGGKIDYSGFG